MAKPSPNLGVAPGVGAGAVAGRCLEEDCPPASPLPQVPQGRHPLPRALALLSLRGWHESCLCPAGHACTHSHARGWKAASHTLTCTLQESCIAHTLKHVAQWQGRCSAHSYACARAAGKLDQSVLNRQEHPTHAGHAGVVATTCSMCNEPWRSFI